MSAPNAELAYRVLDQIDAHPETWNQAAWDCGTAACFAGWALRLSGAKLDGGLVPAVCDGPEHLIGLHVDVAACRVLRIDDDVVGEDTDDEEWLFASHNSRADLGRIVEEIFGPRPDRAS